MTQSDPSYVRVWDPLIRILHWILVIAFFTAYFTEEDLLTTHSWAGYVVGAAVVVRVIWGFVGPRRARFTDFLYSPRRILRYSVELIRLYPRERYLGHSPAGGAMVAVLLLALAITVWSGLEVLATEEGAGPLARAELDGATMSGISPASANGDEQFYKEAEEGIEGGGVLDWEEIHEVAANGTLVLMILHIAGVLLASFAHRENIIRAMFTGRKRKD